MAAPNWDTSNLARLEAIVVGQRHLWDANPHPVIVTTADPNAPTIIMVNGALLSATGYTMEEVLGRTPKMFQGPATDRQVLDKLRRALESGQAIQAAVVNYRKNGSPYLTTMNITPVRDPDEQLTHFVSIQRFQDVRT